MSRVHNDTISIPVTYAHIPENMMVGNNLPDHITIDVQARGFRLLYNRVIQNWSSVEISVDPDGTIAKSKRNFLVLPLQSRINDITGQLGRDVKVISIQPDSIYFRFDVKSTRRVPVIPVGEVRFREQYGQSGPIRVFPDSITISGSRRDLEAIDSVVTEKFAAPSLRTTYRNWAGIKPISGVMFSQPRVEVEIPVEAFTEKTLEVPVTMVNIPDSVKMQIIPEKVTIKVWVGVSQFAKVVPESFGLEVTYPSPAQRNIPKVIVSVARQPAFVRIIDIDPPSVEYIIMVKR
jgi:hypothetical protein